MASGSRKAIALGGALLALVALVTLASRGHAPAGGTGGTRHVNGDLVFEYATLIVLLLALAGLPVLVWALWGSRRDATALPARGNWMLRVLGTITLIAVVLSLLMGWRLFRREQEGKPGAKKGQATSIFDRKPPRAKQPRAFAFDWAPVIVVFSVGLGGAALAGAFLLRARRRREPPSRAAVAAAFSEVLDDSLDDLRNERDPRRAVIAAYARMEKALAFAGLPRRESEAPLEYLGRVLRDLLDAGAASVSRLTALFERAKFSRHEIGPELKDEAIEALVAVRDELRAFAP